MLIRDVVPAQKIKRIAKEEILGMKVYEDKKSKYFHLSLRAVFFCVLIFTVLPLFYSRASEEDVLEMAQQSIEELGSNIGEISTNVGDGIASGIEEIAAGIGELLGIEEEEAPNEESFEALPMEEENQTAEQQSPASLPPAAKVEMTKMEKIISKGKEGFVTKNPAGDEAGFFDADETSDQPYLKLDKWGGEARLKIKIPHANNGSKKLENNRLKVKNEKYEVEVYPRSSQEIIENIAGASYPFTINSDGGVEFDVVLDRVPESNVFEFPVESAGLKFYYQPPLDPEHPTWADADGDGTADRFRPEMVVGSYAVYYAAKERMMKSEEDAEKYKTGKAFHIYRPKVTDAAGNEIWGELYFDAATGSLKVTVDAAWLSGATYPVRIDPNIGYESIGGSNGSYGSGNIESTFGVDGGNGSVATINVYGRSSGFMASAKCNIYDSDFTPITTTGTAGLYFFQTATWWPFAFSSPPTISSSETYYPTVWLGGTVYLYFDVVDEEDIVDDYRSYGSSWPNPANVEYLDTIFSIYATYESSTGGARAPGIGISGDGMLMF